jgi:hypothetical protein
MSDIHSKNIGDAWKIIKFNPKVIIPPILLSLFVPFLALIFLLINKLFPTSLSIEGMISQITSSLSLLFTSLPYTITFFASAIILIIISVVIGLTLQAMGYVMITAASYKKKIGLFSSWRKSANFIIPMFWLKFVTSLIYLVTFGILALFLIIDSIALALLAVLVMILFAIFYAVSFFYNIPVIFYLEKRDPFLVIKRSYKFLRRNLGYVILTMIIFIVLKLGLGLFTSLISRIGMIFSIGGSLIPGTLATILISLILGALVKAFIDSYLFSSFKNKITP